MRRGLAVEGAARKTTGHSARSLACLGIVLVLAAAFWMVAVCIVDYFLALGPRGF